MISFPNAKINIGLSVTEKREDGFHNLETIMYPIPLTDALEFIESPTFQFETSGLPIEGDSVQNLVVKAYHLLKQRFNLPPIHIHLHKNIPMGAGLGGGSADGAFMLKMMNEYFSLNLTMGELEKLASELGSDCAFFIRNKPVFASGRGEIMEPVLLDLSNYYFLLLKPTFGISTKEAYSNVIPQKSRLSLKALIDFSITEWQCNIENQFEKTIFPEYPELSEIKNKLYELGAVYSSMSGSGSAVYGIFQTDPKRFISQFPNGYFSYSDRF